MRELTDTELNEVSGGWEHRKKTTNRVDADVNQNNYNFGNVAGNLIQQNSSNIFTGFFPFG